MAPSVHSLLGRWRQALLAVEHKIRLQPSCSFVLPTSLLLSLTSSMETKLLASNVEAPAVSFTFSTITCTRSAILQQCVPLLQNACHVLDALLLIYVICLCRQAVNEAGGLPSRCFNMLFEHVETENIFLSCIHYLPSASNHFRLQSATSTFTARPGAGPLVLLVPMRLRLAICHGRCATRILCHAGLCHAPKQIACHRPALAGQYLRWCQNGA